MMRVTARPGTAGNDVERSGMPNNPRRHSTVVDNGMGIAGPGMHTTTIPQLSPIETANAKGESVGQRDDTASRQTMRPDDGKARWTLGRTASARIKEGLGFKRSMSTQNV